LTCFIDGQVGMDTNNLESTNFTILHRVGYHSNEYME